MKDSEYDYFDCLRFYDLGKCMFHFLEKLDLAAMDDALNCRFEQPRHLCHGAHWAGAG